MASVASLPDLRPGSIFAEEFRVVSLLGRGGMGAVYRVEHLPTGKPRALKVLAALGSQVRARERFELEARINARVHSEHIVDVIAAGFEGPDELPWIAMELLQGADLRALARRHGRVPRGMLREVFYQLVQGLSAAHRAGVIHRDLKPENVFVSRSERLDEPFLVKVLDFGIAKLVQEGRAVASATSTVGTPLWIAPEQLNRGSLSVQTDVWSLGLLVFWSLTGRPYWEAANGEDIALEALLAEILLSPLQPASERAVALGVPRGVVPEALDEWFERCVAREPELRFDSVSEAGRELDRALRFLRADVGDPAVDEALEAVGTVGVEAMAGGRATITVPGSIGGRADDTVQAPVLSAAIVPQVLHTDRFFRVVLRPDGIVHVARSAERSDDLEAFLRASEEVLGVVRDVEATARGMLMDFRLAPPRNDAQFEDAMRPYRYFMGTSSRRVVFLVATMAGMLQLRRLGGLIDTSFHAYRDEDEALEYLRSIDEPQPESRDGPGGAQG
jgi:hypothetical protein